MLLRGWSISSRHCILFSQILFFLAHITLRAKRPLTVQRGTAHWFELFESTSAFNPHQPLLAVAQRQQQHMPSLHYYRDVMRLRALRRISCKVKENEQTARVATRLYSKETEQTTRTHTV